MTSIAQSRGASVLPFVYMAGGIFLLSVMDSVVKGLSVAGYTTPQIVTMRYWTATLILIPLAFRLGGRWLSRPALLAGLARGILTFVAASSFFHALGLIPLAIAVTLGFTTPFLVALIARIFLGEPIATRTILAIVLGLSGVSVVMASEIVTIRPGRDIADTVTGCVLVLVASLSVASIFVLMRARKGGEGAIRMTFLQTLVAALLATAPGIVSWQPVAAMDWPLFLSTGALGAAGMSLIAAAFIRAPAARLAPFDYTAFVWATLIGYVVFKEPVDLSTFAGAALIISGCLLAASAGTGD